MNRLRKGLVVLAVVMALGVGVFSTNAANTTPKFNALASYEEIGKTKEDILGYKMANNNKIDKLNKEVAAENKIRVTITLAKHLNESQLSKLVKDHGLDVHHVIVRAIEGGTGLRSTMSLAPTKDQVYDKEALKDMLDSHDATLKGFIEIVAYVPNGNLQKLKNDRLVFLVDPSADRNLTQNPEGDFMPGLFWTLEDFDMLMQ